MTKTKPIRDVVRTVLTTTIKDGRQEILPRAQEDDGDEDVHEEQRGEQPQETLEEFLEGMFGEEQEFNAEGIPTVGWLKKKFKTKSAVIRYLFQEKGMSVKEISKHTGFLYQQCRNVLTNELKRGPNEQFVLGKDEQVVKALVPLLPKKVSLPKEE